MSGSLRIIRTVEELRAFRRSLSPKTSVGFVPTMGALHQGHLELGKNLTLILVKAARKQSDQVIASIFVNPSQFGINEDLDKYPRTEDADIKLLAAESADVVFIPSVAEMYPLGMNLEVEKQVGTFVSVHGLSHQLEGNIRPQMFRGVATVLSKLFNLAEPTSAYFGQKDIQQCIVVKRLIKDMLWSIKMNIIPTCRESDGLAMSSRNRYLNEQERKDAPILYESLQKGVEEYQKGLRDPKKIIDITLKSICNNPRVTVDYINLSDPENLHDLATIDEGAIFSGVIRVGKTRILDNILLGITAQELSRK